MEATRDKQREMWDRLVLLLISRPREGWETEFRAITRREVERLAPVREKRDIDA
jgi:hypothetical protein